MSDLVIEASGLHKRYGDEIAVDEVSLAVPQGRILGVLGPNGAGKSTTVRMLTTMTQPDAGTGRVAGLDIVRDARAVRRLIGVTGQDATLDEQLTGRQNLVLIGRLSKLSRGQARRRAVELLDQFELADAGDRQVKTYSGGMRRRLDLAGSLVTRPPVLFLDEPTTGLDPSSRQRMWDLIRVLVADGTTLLLTTQYLDEADALADTISVIDRGTVIAEGTASELKARIGGERVEVRLSQPHPEAVAALSPLATGAVQVTDDGRRLTAPVVLRHGLATAVIRALDEAGVDVDDIEVHRPSLDDVFFTLTGAPPDSGGPHDPSAPDATDGRSAVAAAPDDSEPAPTEEAYA
ncbi:MAG TPA: ATP-binding cassette domain-containing protein [Acidimicrobiales bacterium]|jgi:daunorubicin resistance ABC transporter ATP-binding subunit|nr:ATP-binding cassette domain-containing protein [Acidimicrobiales bacterium]